MYKCSKCNFETEKRQNFLKHSCKEPTNFQCKFCEKYYSEKKTLNRHLKICKKKPIIKTQEELLQENIKLKKKLKNIIIQFYILLKKK